jgi:hypothetical protein
MSIISSISPSQIALYLTTSQIASLSTADIELLSTRPRSRQMSSAQIHAIETRDMVILSSAQIGAFDASAFTDGIYDKLSLISASQVRGLTTDQLECLHHGACGLPQYQGRRGTEYRAAQQPAKRSAGSVQHGADAVP